MKSDNITPSNPDTDQNWVYRAPLVVTGLIAVMVSVSLVLAFGPKPQMLYLEFWASLYPARYGPAMITNINPLLLIVPPFTHMFLHGGVTHLVLNSLFLLAFGTPLANRFMGITPMPAQHTMFTPTPGAALNQVHVMESHVQGTGNKHLGRLYFLCFFIAGGLAGGFLFSIFHFNEPVRAVGASGAISALMAASIRIARPVRGKGMVNIDGPLLAMNDPRVLRFTIAIIGLNILIGLFGNMFIPGGAKIAWEAHIGGYLFGLFALTWFDTRVRA